MLLSVAWRIDDYDHALGSVAASTRVAYRRDVRGFAEWAGRGGVTAPDQVTPLLLRRYLAFMTTTGAARRTIARRASGLRRYFDWALRQGMVATDPTARLHAPSGDGRLPRVLRADELTALLDERSAATADDGPDRRARDDAVLELLYGSGLRVSEVCGLGPADVDMEQRTVRVVGKGDKERIVPISEPAVAALRRHRSYAGSTTSTGPLFVNQRGNRLSPRDVRRILDRRAQTPTHPHALAPQLRHSSSGRRCRSTLCTGIAGTRGSSDHAGLHAREQGTPAHGLRINTSPGIGQQADTVEQQVSSDELNRLWRDYVGSPGPVAP